MFFKLIFLAVCSIAMMHCKTIKSIEKIQDPSKEKEVYIPDTLGKVAKVVFDSSFYHFGMVKQGEKISRKIYFINKGPGDLVIELVTACECTTLDWPRLPVRVGQKGRIDVEYNSKDKEGLQTVDIDIIANTDPIVSSAKFTITVFK